ASRGPPPRLAGLRAQTAQDFVDEERVAIGLAVDRLYDRLGRGTAGCHRDELSDFRFTQTPQWNVSGAARQAPENRGHCRFLTRLDLAICPDDEHPRLRQRIGNELE